MFPSSILAIVAVILPVTLAYSRPNDLSLSSLDPTSYSCGPACQKLITEAIEEDRSTIYGKIPFSYNFYATASNFSSSSTPGDLLKVEPYIHIAPTSAWQLPGGTTLYRIQYVSLSANDRVVPATAFVAFPFTKPISGGPFNMVAFAHGTIATTYGCAPSSSFNLYDYNTWFPLLFDGYAVVGPDYAGLGNNYTQSHWEANELDANDVIFSAVAARKAFPDLLSERWVVAGHSQGGAAAWSAAESTHLQEAKAMGAELIGSVALEPGIRIADEVAYGIQQATAPKAPANSGLAIEAYISFIYNALNVFDPSATKDIFTDVMANRQELGRNLGMCFYVEAALAVDIAEKEGLTALVKNLTLLDITLQRYQAAYSAGTGKPSNVPMLIVQSVADQTVPYPVTEIGWNATCSAGGQPVELSVYQATDHSASVAASSPEWLKWIGDRFAGVEGVKKCQVHRRVAVDVRDAYLPLDF